MTGVAPRTGRWKGLSAPSVPTGIYGTIICAATLATVGDQPVVVTAVAVAVTVLVYWLAERYAEVLAEGPGLTAARLREVLSSGWPMIEASFTPLLVLLGSRLLGVATGTAVKIALAYTIILLMVLGWLAARRAGLGRRARLAGSAFAGLLGLIVVVLKASLH